MWGRHGERNGGNGWLIAISCCLEPWEEVWVERGEAAGNSKEEEEGNEKEEGL